MSTLELRHRRRGQRPECRAHTHRGGGLEPRQRRVHAGPGRPPVSPARRGAGARSRSSPSATPSGRPPPRACRWSTSCRTSSRAASASSLAPGRRQGRLRRDAERRTGRGDGGHAERGPRLPGQPDGHQPDSRPRCSAHSSWDGKPWQSTTCSAESRPGPSSLLVRRARAPAPGSAVPSVNLVDSVESTNANGQRRRGQDDGRLRRRARRDDRAAARGHDAAVQRAGAQQTGAGLPGNHAHAGVAGC